MPFEAVIESPEDLFDIPRPLDRLNGRTHAQDIWTLTKTKGKKKRNEITLAVDGEGINLYGIQPPRLIASYALPPETIFTCQPYSVLHKSETGAPNRRLTYASVSGKTSNILLFCEPINRRSETSSTTATFGSKASNFELPTSTSPVRSISLIPAYERKDSIWQYDLLLVHENGGIRCLAGDLKTERWHRLGKEIISSGGGRAHKKRPTEVVHVEIMNSVVANQGILKGRGDLKATVGESNANGDPHNSATIVTLITRPATFESSESGRYSINYILIRPVKTSSFIGNVRGSVQLLLKQALPASPISATNLRTHFSLNARFGLLDQLTGNSVVTYDLKGLLPKILTTFNDNDTALDSIIRLSSSAIILATESAVSLFDLRFESLQARLKIGKAEEATSSKKRKRQDVKNGTPSLTRLITYSTKLNLAVGISDGHLVTLRIPQPPSMAKRRNEGMLVNALGKGIRIGTQSETLLNDKLLEDVFLPPAEGSLKFGREAWMARKQELDDLSDERDVVGFEKICADLLRIGITEELNISGNENTPAMNGVNGSTQSDAVHGWENPTDIQTALSAEDFALYLLSRIFSSAQGQQTTQELAMKISFYPPNVFGWLLQNNFISAAQIQRSVRQFKPNDNLAAGFSCRNVIDAVVDHDRSLTLLLEIVETSSTLSAREMVQAIRQIMLSLELFPDELSPPPPRLLTNGEPTAAEDENPDTEAMSIDAEENAAAQDLAHAIAILENDADPRPLALGIALAKLHDFPPTTVRSALRSELSHQEIIYFIHLLRIELERGGWILRYLDQDDPEEDDTVNGVGIALISDLLTNCLCAIGPGGFLGDSFDESQTLIEHLRLEVSAALEGIEEATYLNGLLVELLRYGKSAATVAPELTLENAEPGGKPVAVPLQADLLERSLLPLGLKADQGWDQWKRTAGGGVVKRSARDAGHLRSMKVGKYSLERIVF